MQKILLPLFIFIVIASVGAYFFLIQDNKVNKNIQPTISQEVNIINSKYVEHVIDIQQTQELDSKNYNTAIQNQDIQFCNTIISEASKNDCKDKIVSQNAQKEGNLETCSTLMDTGSQTSCRDNILISIAEKQLAPAQCKEISGEKLRDFCVNKVEGIILLSALEKNIVTQELCESLGNEIRDICFGELIKDNDADIYKNAVSSLNIGMCDKIKKTELQVNCRDAIWLSRALKEDNATFCMSIQIQEKKQFCMSEFSDKQATLDFASIVSSKKKEDCNLLSTELLKSQCNDMIILAEVRNTGDTSLCGGIKLSGMLTTCQQITK